MRSADDGRGGTGRGSKRKFVYDLVEVCRLEMMPHCKMDVVF